MGSTVGATKIEGAPEPKPLRVCFHLADGLGRDRIKATCPTSRDSVVKCPVERHISYGTFLKEEPMAAFRRPQRAHDLEEGVSLHTRRLAERRLTTVEARGLDGPRLGAE